MNPPSSKTLSVIGNGESRRLSLSELPISYSLIKKIVLSKKKILDYTLSSNLLRADES